MKNNKLFIIDHIQKNDNLCTNVVAKFIYSRMCLFCYFLLPEVYFKEEHNKGND